MRRALSEIIKEVLKEGAMTPKELRERTKQKASEIRKSFSEQNYHYHLKKLVDRREIRKIPKTYELIKEVTEIDRLEVQECIETIRRDEREGVLQGRIRQLRILSENRRIAHLPNVIPTLKDSLENSKIIDNPKTFEELTLILRNILRREREYKSSDSKQIIMEITTGALYKIIDIIKIKPEFPGENTIRFLGESGKKEAVEILFELIHKFKHELDQNQIETLALASKDLYPKYLPIINKNIDDLIVSQDEELRKIGKKLRERISWMRIKD